jgi:hypothetical protein
MAISLAIFQLPPPLAILLRARMALGLPVAPGGFTSRDAVLALFAQRHPEHLARETRRMPTAERMSFVTPSFKLAVVPHSPALGRASYSVSNIGDSMNRFQQGSLLKLARKSCPDVWVFRWYDDASGKRTYKKQIIGNVTKLQNREEAEKAVIALRSSINVEVGMPKSVCDLAAHYRLYELTGERKAFSTIDNHRQLFKRYIEPRWGHLQRNAVRLDSSQRQQACWPC